MGLQLESSSQSHGVSLARVVQNRVESRLDPTNWRRRGVMNDLSTRLTVEAVELAIMEAVLLLGIQVTVSGRETKV